MLKHLVKQIKTAMLALFILGIGSLIWGFWIPLKAEIAQYLLDRAWQQSLNTGQPQKAWSWADSWPIAKLTIDELKFETIVLKEAGGEGLAFGPVHLEQSASLGARGTSVIAAHRDTHFKVLADLEMGTQITVQQMIGPPQTYQVIDMRVARWDQSGLDRASQSTQLAITTCWPFDSLVASPLRFIATAVRVDQRAELINSK